MKSRQAGFTMIELIVVIVILGILAATALPKFIDMREDAQRAAVEGVAGAAASAMTLNYSGCSLTNNLAVAGKCMSIRNCDQVGSLLQGGLPTDYSVASGAIAAIGDTATCTITGEGSRTATFTGIGAGPAT